MGGGNNKRRKEKEKLKGAQKAAGEEFLGIRYSSYVRADQPKNAVVLRRLGSTGEFVKDHGVDRRIVRRGVVVKKEVLKEAFIVNNFQFILRPEAFYASDIGANSFAAAEERSSLVAQGLVDDFPTDSKQSQSLATALATFDAKIHWRHVIAVATRVDVDEIRCPICFESPTAPRVTPCGHIFCFHCILRSMNAQKKLGIGYGGASPTPTVVGSSRPAAGRGGGFVPAPPGGAAAAASAGNALGSGDNYGTRPRTCPMCASGIDIQGLRPCYIMPYEPLTEAAVKAQPNRTFGLACRSANSTIVVPAAGADGYQGSARLAAGGGGSDDPAASLVAMTLLEKPNFIPQYGTPLARFSRYAHAATDLLRELFQMEITDIERQMRVLKEDRFDPTAPLDEGEVYEQNALQGVFTHLSTYGYSTIATSDCESASGPNGNLNRARGNVSTPTVNLNATPVNSPTPNNVGKLNRQQFPSVGSLANLEREGSAQSFLNGATPPPLAPSSPQRQNAAGGAGLGLPPRQPSTTNLTITNNIHTQRQQTATANGDRSNIMAVANGPTHSPLVWQYRLDDGQQVYLHPLNIRMLLKHAELEAQRAWDAEAAALGRGETCEEGQAPLASALTGDEKETAVLAYATHLLPSLTAKVLELELVTQQPFTTAAGGPNTNAARVARVFANVPPHATSYQAFVDLSGIVSREVMDLFKAQVMERLKDVHRRKRKVEGVDRMARGGGSSSYHQQQPKQGTSSGAFGRSAAAATASASPPPSHGIGAEGTLGDEEEDYDAYDDEEGYYEEYLEDEEEDEDYDGDNSHRAMRLSSDAVSKASQAHSGSNAGGGNNPAVWVDAHTTPAAVASYEAREREVLRHPDEVRGGAAAVPGNHETVTAAGKTDASAAADDADYHYDPADFEGGNEVGGHDDDDGEDHDDGFYHGDDYDDDDYYYDDEHEGYGGGGGGVKMRHRYMDASGGDHGISGRVYGNASVKKAAKKKAAAAALAGGATAVAAASALNAGATSFTPSYMKASQPATAPTTSDGSTAPNSGAAAQPTPTAAATTVVIPKIKDKKGAKAAARANGTAKKSPAVVYDHDPLLARPTAAATSTEASSTPAAVSTPAAPPADDDMAAILAGLDLTEEEQMWLLQEQEKEQQRRRARNIAANGGYDTVDMSAFATPGVAEQWGSASGTKGGASTPPITTPPPSSTWAQRPKHFDANAFPDLPGFTLGAPAAGGEGSAPAPASNGGGWGAQKATPARTNPQPQQPSLSELGAHGANRRQPKDNNGWTTITSQPPRRSWKEDADDDLDAYFPPTTGASSAPTNGAQGGAWAKKK